MKEFDTELFFLVVAGAEDLAVLVEAIDQTFDGVGRGRSHRGSAYRALRQCQPTGREGRGCRTRVWRGPILGGTDDAWPSLSSRLDELPWPELVKAGR